MNAAFLCLVFVLWISAAVSTLPEEQREESLDCVLFDSDANDTKVGDFFPVLLW